MCKDLIDNYRDLFNVTKEELDREEAIMRKTENFNRNPNPVKVSLNYGWDSESTHSSDLSQVSDSTRIFDHLYSNN